MQPTTMASVWAVCAVHMDAAAAYPERPLRLIVASAPGGGPDVASRLIAGQLARYDGNPSTNLAMMLRWTSLVPAPIVVGREI